MDLRREEEEEDDDEEPSPPRAGVRGRHGAARLAVEQRWSRRREPHTRSDARPRGHRGAARLAEGTTHTQSKRNRRPRAVLEQGLE
nr:unnamed protein product [Digitaria exilis]